MEKIAELRLGRTANSAAQLEEIERKINEMIRLLNELVEAAQEPTA